MEAECDILSRDFLVSGLFSFFLRVLVSVSTNLISKKVSVSVSGSQKFFVTIKVSVSVSKLFGLEKVSITVSKIWVSKKSLGIGLENLGLKKSLNHNKCFKCEKSDSIGVDRFGLKKVSLCKGLEKSLGIYFTFFKIESESAISYSYSSSCADIIQITL